MTSEEEKESFLKIIEEDRYDAVARLVFADWLEERGQDDEAAEQRRMASKEWIEADRWMHAFADSLGGTCVNYDTVCQYNEAERRWEETEPERWEKITYDLVMKAAQASVDTLDADRLVQVGSEEARDQMSNPDTRQQFWAAWQAITGQTLSEDAKEGRVFCCTC